MENPANMFRYRSLIRLALEYYPKSFYFDKRIKIVFLT